MVNFNQEINTQVDLGLLKSILVESYRIYTIGRRC